ncbi:MAG: serine/threonine-protein kinase [Pyrinomonadaceae bacterium]
MSDLDFTGQTLDGKYQMTRELGKGGMGTVYLATHLGTERPVAVKIISPEFMQRTEFVERFRREARAAGRLRHPNVVNVTDFGFAETDEGQVAYLVMEYLDGCTLGEILDEEKNLPVGWTLNILEQVCSAVHEAHKQGIIHRDLKPDNIWLEPNQRGGYTVKVLDFGIAKLEEHIMPDGGEVPEEFKRSTHTHVGAAKATFAGADADGTRIDGIFDTQIANAPTVAKDSDKGGTLISEASTVLLAQPASENATAIYDSGANVADQDTIGTRVSNPSGVRDSAAGKSTTARSLYDDSGSAELTRVGAVLGTPLYMSPEQCRGEHLDARSDIYSLAVIAYQMLSGEPPFKGDFKDVMESHKSVEPAPLKAKHVRRKMRKAIHAALEKDPDDRPETAEAFASVMRSRSEGIWQLLSRTLVLYSEHLPKYLMLSLFFSIPIIVLTLILLSLSFFKVSDIIMGSAADVSIVLASFTLTMASAFCTNLIVGSISWIVIQYLSVPLRPVRLRPALKEAKRKWKRIAGSAFLTALSPFLAAAAGAIAGFLVGGLIMGILYPLTGSVGGIFIGGGVGALIAGAIGFFGAYLSFILVPPVVMLENVGVIEALRRSRTLVKRSIVTSMGAIFIMLLIPGIIAASISFVVNVSARAFDPKPKPETAAVQITSASEEVIAAPIATPEEKETAWNWSFGRKGVQLDTENKSPEADMRTRVRTTILESLIQILWLPMQIFVFSFSAIIVALLYLKTRLAGGESMHDLIERFEDDGRPRKKWQERVRARLIQSGRISSKS